MMTIMVKNPKSLVSTSSKLQATGTAKTLLAALLLVSHGAQAAQLRQMPITLPAKVDKKIRKRWKLTEFQSTYNYQAGGEKYFELAWVGKDGDSKFRFESMDSVQRQENDFGLEIQGHRSMKAGGPQRTTCAMKLRFKNEPDLMRFFTPLAQAEMLANENLRVQEARRVEKARRVEEARKKFQDGYTPMTRRHSASVRNVSAAPSRRATRRRRNSAPGNYEKLDTVAALNAYAAGNQTVNIDDAFNAVIAAWERKFPDANTTFTVQQLTDFLRDEKDNGAGYSAEVLKYRNLKKLCKKVNHKKWAGK